MRRAAPWAWLLTATLVVAGLVTDAHAAPTPRAERVLVVTTHAVTIGPESVRLGPAGHVSLFVPALGKGMVVLAAPDGGPDPVSLPLGTGYGVLHLHAHQRYAIDVAASDSASRVRWPGGIKILRRHALQRQPVLAEKELTKASGAASAGWLDNPAQQRSLVVTAVIAYWPVGPDVAVRQADACTAGQKADPCLDDPSAHGFVEHTIWLYDSGKRSERLTQGRTYVGEQSEPYVTGRIAALSNAAYAHAVLVVYGI